MIHTANHELDDPTQPLSDRGWRDDGPLEIGHNSWIGMGACVLPGVTIGGGLRRRRGQRGHGRPPGLHGLGRQPREGHPRAGPLSDRPMRVLFLEQQPCIRALKIGVGPPLAMPGLELGFAYRGKSLTEWYGPATRRFDRLWRLTRRGPGSPPSWRSSQPDAHPLPQPAGRPDRARHRARRGPGAGRPRRPRPSEPAPDAVRGRLPRAGRPAPLERRAIEESDALVTVSAELLAEIRTPLPGPRPGAGLPQLRAAARSAATPRLRRAPPRRPAAPRLPGDALGERRPLRPARDLPGARRRGRRRWTSTRTATCRTTASWPSVSPASSSTRRDRRPTCSASCRATTSAGAASTRA